MENHPCDFPAAIHRKILFFCSLVLHWIESQQGLRSRLGIWRRAGMRGNEQDVFLLVAAQLHQLISSNNRYFREAAFLGYFGFFFFNIRRSAYLALCHSTFRLDAFIQKTLLLNQKGWGWCRLKKSYGLCCREARLEALGGYYHPPKGTRHGQNSSVCVKSFAKARPWCPAHTLLHALTARSSVCCFSWIQISLSLINQEYLTLLEGCVVTITPAPSVVYPAGSCLWFGLPFLPRGAETPNVELWNYCLSCVVTVLCTWTSPNPWG